MDGCDSFYAYYQKFHDQIGQKFPRISRLYRHGLFDSFQNNHDPGMRKHNFQQKPATHLDRWAGWCGLGMSVDFVEFRRLAIATCPVTGKAPEAHDTRSRTVPRPRPVRRSPWRGGPAVGRTARRSESRSRELRADGHGCLVSLLMILFART